MCQTASPAVAETPSSRSCQAPAAMFPDRRFLLAMWRRYRRWAQPAARAATARISPSPPPDARILYQPTDIIAEIAQHLEPESVASLALTCKALFCLLFQSAYLDRKSPSLPAFLQLLERDMAEDRYYCEFCNTLHKFLRPANTPYRARDVPVCGRQVLERRLSGSNLVFDFHHARLAVNRHLYGQQAGLPLEIFNCLLAHCPWSLGTGRVTIPIGVAGISTARQRPAEKQQLLGRELPAVDTVLDRQHRPRRARSPRRLDHHRLGRRGRCTAAPGCRLELPPHLPAHPGAKPVRTEPQLRERTQSTRVVRPNRRLHAGPLSRGLWPMSDRLRDNN